MSSPSTDHHRYLAVRPPQSLDDMLAAKNTPPIRSLNDLTADTFESDDELEQFLAYTYAERHRDVG